MGKFAQGGTIMSMEFDFAGVPFGEDGDLCELFDDESNNLREGVVFFKTKRERELYLGYLGFNNSGVTYVDKMTQDAFLELCGGRENQRYLLLEPRKQHLARLREMLPSLPEDNEWQRNLKEQLKCLLENADACLAEHGSRAAMLIY